MFWFWIWLSKNCRLHDVSHQKSLSDRRCLIKIPQFFIQQKCFHIFYGRMSQQRQFSLERNKERLVLIPLFPRTLIVMKILHLIFIHRAQDNHPAKAPVQYVRTCLPQKQSLKFKVSPDSTMTNHSFISSFLEIFLNMKRRVIFQNRSVGQDKCSLKANKF